MRFESWKKVGLGAAAMLVVVTVIPGAPGWAEAAVSTVSSVVVTNTASQAVPVREQNRDTLGNIKVHEQGTAKVSVTNGTLPVSTRPLASVPWNYFIRSNGLYQPLFVPPGGATTLALTSLTTANLVNYANEVVFTLFSNADCSGASRDIDEDVVPALNTVHQDFPQPIVITGSGWSLCLFSSGTTQTVTAVGYYF
jgi:hypothetical protein